MATGSIATVERPIPLEERQGLVERIAGSQELRRSARLRAFLVYVCGRSLSEGVTVLHEQEIGAAVFGRPASYDTAIDNIVRVNATELRKRLERYFAEEGAGEEILLELQRGSYTPVFRRRHVEQRAVAAAQDAPARRDSMAETSAAEPVAAAAADPHDAGDRMRAVADVAKTPAAGSARAGISSGLRWWQAGFGVLLLSCAGLSWWVHSLTMQMEPWRHDPALRAFWSEFFDSGTETDVLLADTSFALAEDMMQRSIPLSDYLNYEYKHYAEAPELPDARRQDLAQVLDRNNGSIADFRVGQQILSLDSGPRRFNLKFAREYTPDAAKHHNMVLIGSRESNPWVSLFSDRLNFDLAYDAVERHPIVVNRNPRAGELKSYPLSQNRLDADSGYALIAYMPDVSGKGKALIIAGTDSQATGAAGDFVTNEDSLESLEQKFPAGRIPFFEVLLRTSQLSGTPLHGEVVAYRIYK